MEKISNEISKKVISLSSGNVIGYVLDILFNENLNEINGYIIADEESDEVFFLDYKNSKAESDECFVIEKEDDLEIYISSVYNNPIGKDVYDEKGESLGKVTNVYFDKKHVKRIITTRCEFPICYLQKAGNDCLIFGKKKRKKCNAKRFEQKGMFPSVYIQNEIKLEKKEGEHPVKLRIENNSALGKRVTHDIFGLNNELIARKDEKVTKSILQKAKLHNKYNLLLFYLA